MGGLSRRRILVPAVLSVTAITGCPAGDGDGGSTTTEDTSSSSTVTSTSSTTMSSTATDSSGSSEASSGDASSGSGTSTDGSSGETGEIPTCTDLADEAACTAEAQCIYLAELGGCIRNCEMIEDLAVCEQSPGCVVFEDTCGFEPVE